jgi:hypothetical protein
MLHTVGGALHNIFTMDLRLAKTSVIIIVKWDYAYRK